LAEQFQVAVCKTAKAGATPARDSSFVSQSLKAMLLGDTSIK
jgi:hypothetical protein